MLDSSLNLLELSQFQNN